MIGATISARKVVGGDGWKPIVCLEVSKGEPIEYSSKSVFPALGEATAIATNMLEKIIEDCGGHETEWQIFWFDLPYTVSLNQAYAGQDYHLRMKHQKDFGHAVINACMVQNVSAVESYPVHVTYHFCMAKRRYDVSNLAYMVKLIEDGLCAAEILRGDGPNDVYRITTTQEKIDHKKRSSVIVTINRKPKIEVWEEATNITARKGGKHAALES